MRALPIWLLALASSARAADVPPAVVTAGSMLQVMLGLGVVLVAVAGTAWLLKRFAVQPRNAAGVLRVIAGAAVGQRERVVLIEIGATWLLVGVAPGQVRALHTMPKSELAPAAAAPADERSFAAWLRQMMERRGAN